MHLRFKTSKRAILKAALLTYPCLRGIPSFRTVDDCVATRVVLVDGPCDMSRFVKKDGIGEFGCKVGPSAKDLPPLLGLSGSNSF
jgi:hypothetical protein